MVSGAGGEMQGAVPARVYIGLGSNLGDRAGTIRAALRDLEERADIRVVRCSAVRETVAVGGPPGQGNYLNAVAQLDTALSPQELLARLLEIERRHGRRRELRNGPRTLDLDLLLYGDRVIDEEGLTVPHPRMWERAFVMQPLLEICDAATLDEVRGKVWARSSARTRER